MYMLNINFEDLLLEDVPFYNEDYSFYGTCKERNIKKVVDLSNLLTDYYLSDKCSKSQIRGFIKLCKLSYMRGVAGFVPIPDDCKLFKESYYRSLSCIEGRELIDCGLTQKQVDVIMLYIKKICNPNNDLKDVFHTLENVPALNQVAPNLTDVVSIILPFISFAKSGEPKIIEDSEQVISTFYNILSCNYDTLEKDMLELTEKLNRCKEMLDIVSNINNTKVRTKEK